MQNVRRALVGGITIFITYTISFLVFGQFIESRQRWVLASVIFGTVTTYLIWTILERKGIASPLNKDGNS